MATGNKSHTSGQEKSNPSSSIFAGEKFLRFSQEGLCFLVFDRLLVILSYSVFSSSSQSRELAICRAILRTDSSSVSSALIFSTTSE